MERQRKRELRELNSRVWAGDKDVFSVDSSLDSSLKKNTAFIKRIRTSITASGTTTFLTEIRTLSLHKYLSEIITACYEGICKLKIPGDIAAGVEVLSALHQRFGPDEFTGYIGFYIGRGLSTPDKAQLKTQPQDVREREEKERPNRHRILLRIAMELWLVGVLRSLDDIVRPEEAAKTKENSKPTATAAQRILNGVRGVTGSGPGIGSDAEPFPLEVLKDLTSQDTSHTNLSLVVQFVKSFSWDLLGKKGPEDEATNGDDALMVDKSMQQRFKNVLSRYFEGATSHLQKDQASLNNQSRRNAEAYVRSGEVFEDRQANYEKQVKAQERFVSSMQILAEALDLEMPDLADKDAAATATDRSIGLVKAGEYLRGEGDAAGIWEDEEERRFYENIMDLKDRVPGILFEDHKKKKVDGDDQVGRKIEEKPVIKEVTADTSDATDTKEESGDQSTGIANKSVGAQVDALLARLPDLTSKDSVDEVAHEFCFFNSKASRNRLIKAVSEIPRGRSDLLPLYSRLVATLAKYMPDVAEALVKHLDEEFRSLQRRKAKDSLGGIRTSNIRYLAELTKFSVVPEHVIFHCLKVSLEDFSKMNIEIICNLLENCGRYLLRNPETSPRMRSFLETLQRKKSAQHIGQQERMLIENAIYYVNPPDRAAIQQKERTPTELFVRKLIYLDLTKRNIERVAKHIRKLHWEEPEVVTILHKIFAKPYNIKYSSIHFLAILLLAVNRYYQEFAISVIDDLIENIILGLEVNDFKFNQRRIAQVKYLGELYVYKLVDSSVMFDTMNLILTYGHGAALAPGNICPIDLPDDFFRIRLVCVLLETCGTYWEKGAAKKKLDFFLTFLQYYISTKESLPMDVDFDVQDVFALIRPQWKFLTTLEEAGNAFAEACKEQYRLESSGIAVDQLDGDVDGRDDVDDDGELDGARTPPVDHSSGSGDEEDAGEDEPLSSPGADSFEDEQIVVTRLEDECDPEADAEFGRELAKMMAESLETRKVEKRPLFDVVLPTRRTQRETLGADEDEAQANGNTIKFSLLSKKGNKPQTRAIDLPSDSSFAVAMRTQQEAERAEQQRIKRLVLNYDTLRNDDDDPSGIYNSALQRNPNHRLRQSPDKSIAAFIEYEPDTKPKQIGDSSMSTEKGQQKNGQVPSAEFVLRASHGKGSRKPQPKKLQMHDMNWT